ncbi:MAG: M20/M25/M40 family metallo-hydrolase [Candidatus Muiribacteriaceae bacterium]
MDKVVDIFLDMVKVDSESGKERKFADYVKTLFEIPDVEIIEDRKSMDKTGSDAPNLIIHVPAKGSDKPAIGLSAHLDTVVPGIDIRPKVSDGVITASGDTILGADDKSGIAAIYHALIRIMEDGMDRREAYIVLTTSEEIGLLGAKNLDVTLLNGLKDMVVFDSSGKFGTVVVSAPSQNSIKMKIKGRPAHAGLEPEKGLNAIMAGAQGLAQLEIGRIDHETTCNIGVIKGGRATNIVADELIIEGEVRSLSEEKLEKVTHNIVSTMEKHVRQTGCSIETEVVHEYSSYNTPDTSMLLQDVLKAGELMGVDFVKGSTGGGSDTNIHNSNGLNAVNVSTGMQNPHTLEEYIEIDDLVKTRDFVINLLTK